MIKNLSPQYFPPKDFQKKLCVKCENDLFCFSYNGCPMDQCPRCDFFYLFHKQIIRAREEYLESISWMPMNNEKLVLMRK